MVRGKQMKQLELPFEKNELDKEKKFKKDIYLKKKNYINERSSTYLHIYFKVYG